MNAICMAARFTPRDLLQADQFPLGRQLRALSLSREGITIAAIVHGKRQLELE